jgi:hypothetical protein
MEHRKKDRRSYNKTPGFPFLTRTGLARKERRSYVDRRIRETHPTRFKA